MGPGAPVPLGTVCLAGGAAAVGFFTVRTWGYRLGVVLIVVNLAGDLVSAALGIERRALIGIPVVALVLWYLSSRVRDYFQRRGRSHVETARQ